MQPGIDKMLGCIIEELGDVTRLCGQCIATGESISEGSQRRIRVEMHEAVAAYEVWLESLNVDSVLDRFIVEAKKAEIKRKIKGG